MVMTPREERDQILLDAGHAILGLEGDFQTGGMVSRVVMIVEFHDEQGEPFVRCVTTDSSEWWQTLGLLGAAERIMIPGSDHINADRQD